MLILSLLWAPALGQETHHFFEKYNNFLEESDYNTKNAEAWNYRGIQLAAQGKYDEAIKAYDRAIELDPKQAEAWSNKCLALDYMDRYHEAVVACDRAIEIDPQISGAWSQQMPRSR